MYLGSLLFVKVLNSVNGLRLVSRVACTRVYQCTDCERERERGGGGEREREN